VPQDIFFGNFKTVKAKEYGFLALSTVDTALSFAWSAMNSLDFLVRHMMSSEGYLYPI